MKLLKKAQITNKIYKISHFVYKMIFYGFSLHKIWFVVKKS